MKKALILSTVMLFMCSSICGCENNSSDKQNTDKNVHYISYLTNYYDNGVIFGGRDTAMYLDFKTMEKTFLCSKPNCSHSGSDCLAKLMGGGIAIHNGYAYFFESSYGVNETPDGRKFYIDSSLKKASLSTSEVETVCTFTDCYPENYDGMILYDGDLYFIGDNLNPRYDEFGNVSGSSNAGGIHYLCSINLDSGKYTNYGSIYDGDKQYESASFSSGANICGYQGNTFYIEYNFIGEEPDLSSDLSSAFGSFTSIIFSYDLITKEMTQTDKLYPACANDTAYVYGIPGTNETVVEIDGEEKHITDYRATVNGRVFNNKLFFEDRWYDLADMSLHSLGKYEKWFVAAYYDDCYIMMNGGMSVKLTEKELFALDNE